MFGSKKQQPVRSQPPHKMTQEDAVERFRKCLRAVDGFLRQGDLDEARARLAEAEKLEPNNPYLRAFEERIRYLEKNPDVANPVEHSRVSSSPYTGASGDPRSLLSRSPEEEERRRTEDEYRQKFTAELKNAEQNAVRALEEVEHNRAASLQAVKQEFERAYQTQIAEERRRVKEEAEAVIEAERRKFQEQYDLAVARHNEAVKAIRAELRKNFEQTLYHRLEHISREYDDKIEMLGATIPATQEEKIALYRQRMSEYYVNGQPSVFDAQRLMRLKELLELTFDEHFEIEAAVRLELYTECLKQKTLSGEITIKQKKKLEDLRKQFGVTKEQERSISGLVESSLKKGKAKARLLIVDDDEDMLALLESHFSEIGYSVSVAPNVALALSNLQESAIDLILCDIKFPEGDLDGFKLFASVQDLPHLKKIPFIFMSALRDGLVMRSGFELGVDDFIAKPFDLDLLESIIAGKLKRFSALTRT